MKSSYSIVSISATLIVLFYLYIVGKYADNPTNALAYPSLLHPPDQQVPRYNFDSTELHSPELNSTRNTSFYHFTLHSGSSWPATPLLRWTVAAYSLNFFLISVGIALFLLTVDESHLAVEGWERNMEGLDADGLTLRDGRLEEGREESDLDTSSFRGSYYAGDGDESDMEAEDDSEIIMPIEMQVKRWTNRVSDLMF